MYAQDLLVVALYLAAVVIFFARVLTTNRYAFPWDIATYHYPAQFFLNRWIDSGVFPAWNPHITLGYPLVGDIASSPFYPFNLLSFALSVGEPLSFKTLEIGVALHIWLAGIFTYMLCRKLQLSRSGAFVGGIALMFGGFFPVRVQNEMWVKSTAWVPLVLLLYKDLLAAGGIRRIIAVAAVMALIPLSGGVHVFLWTGYALLAFTVWDRAGTIRTRQWQPLAISIAVLAATGLIAMLGGAVQLLPAIELTSHSPRNLLTFQEATGRALEFAAIATMALPGLYGTTVENEVASRFGDPSLLHLYCGLSVLAFAVPGAAIKARDRSGQLFFLLLGVVAFLLSLPRTLPFYYIAWKFAPGVALFRGHFFFFVVLALAILAGMGFDAIRERGGRTSRYASVAAVAVLGAYAAAYLMVGSVPNSATALNAALNVDAKQPLMLKGAFGTAMPVLAGICVILFYSCRRTVNPTLLASAYVALVFFDLEYFNSYRSFNTSRRNVALASSAAHIADERMPPAVQEIGQDPLRGRIAIAGYGGMFHNAANIVGFHNYGGYNPLRLRQYTDLVQSIDTPNSRILDLMNVRYVLTSAPFLVAGPKSNQLMRPTTYQFDLPPGPLDAAKFTLVQTSHFGWFQLYENRAALPRFFAASQYLVTGDGARRLRLLHDASIDLRRTVILEEDPQTKLGNCDQAQVQVLAYTPDAIRVSVNSPAPCLLFASENWYPGWVASIDGRKTKLYRANHAFRAIVTTSGLHVVEMRFEPRTLLVGLFVSAATFMALAAAWIFGPWLDVRLLRCRQT